MDCLRHLLVHPRGQSMSPHTFFCAAAASKVSSHRGFKDDQGKIRRWAFLSVSHTHTALHTCPHTHQKRSKPELSSRPNFGKRSTFDTCKEKVVTLLRTEGIIERVTMENHCFISTTRAPPTRTHTHAASSSLRGDVIASVHSASALFPRWYSRGDGSRSVDRRWGLHQHAS